MNSETTRTEHVRAENGGCPAVMVTGAGPAGLLTALALAQSGVRLTLLAPGIGRDYRPADRARDTRTSALLGGSVDLLKNLGLWEALKPDVRPLEAIRIVDRRGGPIPTPEILFRASEIGETAFGHNIANAALVDGLHRAVSAHPGITLHASTAERIVPLDDHVAVTSADGASFKVKLLAAADGRASRARDAMGSAVDRHEYPQVAITITVAHTRAHENVSTEYHRAAGPLTSVPSPDHGGRPASSIVWVETPDEAARLMALDEAAFMTELSSHLTTLLGAMTPISPRASFPLVQLRARTLAARRIALIGEAGHVVPPIGAQGLNLGFRDAASLAGFVGDAVNSGGDPGAPDLLRAYDHAREPDVASRAVMTDVLNRSLMSDMLPVQALRGLGLNALAAIGPLRRFAMRVGMEPPGSRPALMRPAAKVR